MGEKSEEEWADFVRKKPLEPFARDPATLTNCQREEDEWQLSKCGETRLLSDEITETFRPRYTVLAPPLSKHLNRNKLVIEIVLSYSTPLLLATCERAAVRGGHLELGDFSYLLCNSWDMKGYEEKKI